MVLNSSLCQNIVSGNAPQLGPQATGYGWNALHCALCSISSPLEYYAVQFIFSRSADGLGGELFI